MINSSEGKLCVEKVEIARQLQLGEEIEIGVMITVFKYLEGYHKEEGEQVSFLAREYKILSIGFKNATKQN